MGRGRVARGGTAVSSGTKDQKALVKGPMQSELKHLDYRCSDKGTWYYGDTKEEKEIPEQVNW